MKFNYGNFNQIKKNENFDFDYLLCQIEEVDYIESINIAKQKSKFTMNLNQNGEDRTMEVKFNNQLQGVLAEKAIQLFIQQELNLDENITALCVENNFNLPNVVRYDEVRTDGFKFAKREFDLKIVLPHKELFIESRSSKFYAKHQLRKIKEQPIIGKYSQKQK